MISRIIYLYGSSSHRGPKQYIAVQKPWPRSYGRGHWLDRPKKKASFDFIVDKSKAILGRSKKQGPPQKKTCPSFFRGQFFPGRAGFFFTRPTPNLKKKDDLFGKKKKKHPTFWSKIKMTSEKTATKIHRRNFSILDSWIGWITWVHVCWESLFCRCTGCLFHWVADAMPKTNKGTVSSKPANPMSCQPSLPTKPPRFGPSKLEPEKQH